MDIWGAIKEAGCNRDYKNNESIRRVLSLKENIPSLLLATCP